MINLLSFNSRNKLNKIYTYQHFYVFNRIKEYLSSNKPKDKLIISEEDTNEYQKSKKTVIGLNEEPQKYEKTNKFDKTILKKNKKKEPKELSDLERVKRGGVFTSSFQKKKEKKQEISQVKAGMIIRNINILTLILVFKTEEKIKEKFQKDKVLIDELLNEIKLEKAAQTLIELKPEKEVKSIFQKLNLIEEFANGSIAMTNINNEKGDQLIFENKEKYVIWKNKQLLKIKKAIKFKLNPKEEWITQHQGNFQKINGQELKIQEQENTGILTKLDYMPVKYALKEFTGKKNLYLYF